MAVVSPATAEQSEPVPGPTAKDGEQPVTLEAVLGSTASGGSTGPAEEEEVAYQEICGWQIMAHRAIFVPVIGPAGSAIPVSVVPANQGSGVNFDDDDNMDGDAQVAHTRRRPRRRHYGSLASVFTCVGYILLNALAVAITWAGGMQYFVWVPLRCGPADGFARNWMYVWVQPVVVFFVAEFFSSYYNRVVLAALNRRLIRLPHLALQAALAAVLVIPFFAIPIRFGGFYPFNWFAAMLGHDTVWYYFAPRPMMRWQLRGHQTDLDALLATHAMNKAVNNAYMTGFACAMGFILAFYNCPGWAQPFVVLAFSLSTRLLNWVVRAKALLHQDYPFACFSIMSFGMVLHEQAFANFALPSADSIYVLVLIALGQVVFCCFPFGHALAREGE
eukprot:TRINITY_DN6525_c0_g1_i12.p1 TRINITY_DN6525_c0_g1~~TRINITY_DN6525_c0_g1_i12.p1  ORF type:complete len:409 (-),score=60.45 TRINITY_DN6525_c0_g1_i12:65-1231(-)